MNEIEVENEMNMLREIFRLERKIAELELEIDRLRAGEQHVYIDPCYHPSTTVPEYPIPIWNGTVDPQQWVKSG